MRKSQEYLQCCYQNTVPGNGILVTAIEKKNKITVGAKFIHVTQMPHRWCLETFCKLLPKFRLAEAYRAV